MSFNHLADFYPLDFLPFMEGKTIFDASEYLSITVLLPISGLLVALFAGWIVPNNIALSELGIKSKILYLIWRFLLRWLAPVVILLILIFNVI
ncbi:MAG: NSS family neurotransmitter:Na+ symporter [Gammaproteobacteria bacterium]